MTNNLLFIPCYNCQKQIDRVLSKLPEKIHEYFKEILIVNNCSTDNTYHIIKDFFNGHKYNIKINLIDNKQNYGLGGSHKIAFDYACKNNFDNIAVLHGDDQADINDIIPILASEELNKYDCFLGSRFMKYSKLNGYSKIRKYGNIIFNIIFSIILRKRIYDLGSGLNLYRVKILKDGFYKKFPEDLTFNYAMITASDYYKHRLCFFSITWVEKDQISNVKIFKQTIKIISILIGYFMSKSKYIKSDLRQNKIENFDFNKEVVCEVSDY